MNKTDNMEFLFKKLGKYKSYDNKVFFEACPDCGSSETFIYDYATKIFTCNNCGIAYNINELMNNLKLNDLSETIGVNIKFNKANYTNKIDIQFMNKTMKGFFEQYAPIDKYELPNTLLTDDGDSFSFIHLGPKKDIRNIKTIKVNANNQFEKKMLNEYNSLWNVENISHDNIILTFTETDAISLIAKGNLNVVAISSDADIQFIENFYDFLKDIKFFVLAVPQSYHDKWYKELEYRFTKYKIKSFPYNDNLGSLEKAMENLEYYNAITQSYDVVSVKNVIDFSNVNENEFEHIVLDCNERYINSLLGGVRMGELSIVTGMPGAGKSTVVNQLIAKLTDVNENCMLYSGEFRMEFLKKKILEIFAGRKHLEVIPNKFNSNIVERVIANQEIRDVINEFVKNKIFLYEYDLMAFDDEILETIEELYCRTGTKIFVLDNLMSITYKGIDSTEFARNAAQKAFILMLKSLTKKYPIHIFLVAHPKKIEDVSKMTLHDVHGMSELGNTVDNVICIRRFTKEEIKAIYAKYQYKPSIELKLLKDRFYGRIDAAVGAVYDPETGRLSANAEPPYEFKWTKMVKTS